MYLRHFALTRLPFETPAHTDELFDSNSRREAETRLNHLIELRASRASSSRIARSRTPAWSSPQDWMVRSTSPVEMYRGRVDSCHCGTVGTAASSAAATRPTDTRNLRYIRIDVVNSRTWLRVRCSMCSNSARRISRAS